MLPELARLTRVGGLLVSDNLFPLFSDWAQGMGGSDAVKRYLHRPRLRPQIRDPHLPGQVGGLELPSPTRSSSSIAYLSLVGRPDYPKCPQRSVGPLRSIRLRAERV